MVRVGLSLSSSPTAPGALPSHSGIVVGSWKSGAPPRPRPAGGGLGAAGCCCAKLQNATRKRRSEYEQKRRTRERIVVPRANAALYALTYISQMFLALALGRAST